MRSWSAELTTRKKTLESRIEKRPVSTVQLNLWWPSGDILAASKVSNYAEVIGELEPTRAEYALAYSTCPDKILEEECCAGGEV